MPLPTTYKGNYDIFYMDIKHVNVYVTNTRNWLKDRTDGFKRSLYSNLVSTDIA